MKSLIKVCFSFSLISSSVCLSADTDTIAGGRLYDKWWVDTELSAPEGTHPAYPAAGKKKGATTWRCKECHGWDYSGKGGVYKKGSHYTGIKGIRNRAGEDTKKVISILQDKQHQYGDLLSDEMLGAIAQFVSRGQMDMAKYIDGASKKVNGDAGLGKEVFSDNCQRCHGKNGDGLNLSHKKNQLETVGSIANKNPWEALHKIRFGHPGAVMGMMQMQNKGMGMHSGGRMGKGMGMWEAMPPMFGEISESDQVNLLAYLQTLSK